MDTSSIDKDTQATLCLAVDADHSDPISQDFDLTIADRGTSVLFVNQILGPEEIPEDQDATYTVEADGTEYPLYKWYIDPEEALSTTSG
ncbi:MAG TPA: hypothetical protein VGB30_14915 [bacterium]|jgi:hypothetical protein